MILVADIDASVIYFIQIIPPGDKIEHWKIINNALNIIKFTYKAKLNVLCLFLLDLYSKNL